MKTIDARLLLQFSTQELWQILTGEFALRFDDGQVLQTNYRETLYSSYAWEFHRRFPKTPLLAAHHVQTILKGERLNSDTHLEILGTCMWAVYDTYIALPTIEDPAAVDRDPLSEMVYRLTNLMYNELSYRCEEYVVSLDITDYEQVIHHPRIKRANDAFSEIAHTEGATYDEQAKVLEHTYDEVKDTLQKDPLLDNNPLAIGIRSKTTKIDSVLQCVSARGFLTDTDSELFAKVPVDRGYAMGLRLFVHSFVESRSAAKSLSFSKTPLQDAEYFSRRLQLMTQIVQRLHHTDCGSTRYLEWRVRPAEKDDQGRPLRDSDLRMLIGKYYLDEETGQLATIRGSEKHLEGKFVKLRSVLHCAHPDDYGVCATCFGELSLSVPRGTNLGHMCCTSMTQKTSQSVLSVKHMDNSSAVEGITLTDDERRFLRAGSDENHYLLSPDLKGAKYVGLILKPQFAANLNDIVRAPDVRELPITRISEIPEISVRKVTATLDDTAPVVVSVNRRMASMTHDLLAWIKEKGWGYTESGDFTIDLTGWDPTKPLLRLPLKHFNMSDHSKEIAEILESRVEELQMRGGGKLRPEDMLLTLFDLVNSKLSVNLAVLEVTQLGQMIRSLEHQDYSLPKPWTSSGIGVMSESMKMRSLTATFAFKGHRDVIINPLSYVVTNRPDHPMDAIVLPSEVLGAQAKS